MFSETDKYTNHGHFFFEKGDMLSQVSKDVPKLPGVYYVIRLARGKVTLVYIVCAQNLSEAFNDKMIKKSQQQFFEQKIDKESIDALDIYWFVTMDKNNNDLPGYAEGLLMQRYYEANGQLPPWNY